MTVYTNNKKLNYLKLLKELYDKKYLTLKKFKKLFKHFQLHHNPFEKKKIFDSYYKLYLEDKICIELLKDLRIFDNNDTLKN